MDANKDKCQPNVAMTDVFEHLVTSVLIVGVNGEIVCVNPAG